MTKNQIYRLMMIVVFSPIYLTMFVMVKVVLIPVSLYQVTRDIIMIEPQDK